MILVDPRVGSGDLAPLLTKLGCPVEVSQLEFGDCMFLGNGPDGAPVSVGIEVKKLEDVLQCVTSGRFLGHQLPGLVRDYEQVWLVVEGIWRPESDGSLGQLRGREFRTVGHGKQQWMWSSLDKWLTKLEVKAGVHWRRTTNRDETARTIASLYWWWQDSDSHSLDQLDRTIQITLETAVANDRREKTSTWLGERAKPTLARRFAAELPGIGIKMSGGVAMHFGSVENMVGAEEGDWRRIPGIGKTLAQRIVSEITEDIREGD